MSLQAASETIVAHAGDPAPRACAAASGMLAAAESAVGTTTFFEDTRAVLDELARAKASLYIVAWHSPEVAGVTSRILGRAQTFVDAETIAGTEWPTPSELLQVVRAVAAEIDAA